MLKLVKANIIRMYTNIFYSLGVALAFLCTFLFVDIKPVEPLAKLGAEKNMMAVSFATVLYFAMFTGYFVGAEFDAGAIRNKIIAGHSQIKVYISNYLALLVGLVIMYGAWLLGGCVAGCRIDGEMLVFTLVAILYNAAFIGILIAISFRVKATVQAALTGVGLFYVLTTGGLVMNFIVSNTEGVIYKIVRLIYNAGAFGQILLQVGLMDSEVGLGSFVQILCSLTIVALSVFAGTFCLNKRDLK